MSNFLYSLPNCKACERAKELLKRKDIEYNEIVLNDPMSELGVRTLFKGNLYAPVIALEGKGLYIIANSQLTKIKV